MKRIIILSLLLLLTVAAGAQRVNGQFGASFQSQLNGPEGTPQSLHQWTVWGGIMLDPFYPWPIYLDTGLGVSMCIAPDHTAHVYRLELPLDLTVQWEPGPNFGIGPYVGVYGSYNLRVAEDYGPREELNPWNWGLMAGISLRPRAFQLNVGYYRDMMPLKKADAVLKDYFRVGHGIRVSIGWCF